MKKIIVSTLVIGLLMITTPLGTVGQEAVDRTLSDAGELTLRGFSGDFYDECSESSEDMVESDCLADSPSEFAPRQFIIKFRDEVDLCLSLYSDDFLVTGISSIDMLNKMYGVVSAEKIFEDDPVSSLSNVYRFILDDDACILGVVEEYDSDSYVVYAEPNYIFNIDVIPNDEYFSDQWALCNTGQTGGTFDADIDAPEAWDIEKGSSDVVIAVVDSGVDYNHTDLAENIWINPGEDLNGNGVVDPSDFNGVDDDDNGFVDDIRGWDFVDTNAPVYPGEDGKVRDNDPMDFHGHGTHCSGIAGAVTDNGVGIAGVCWNCGILSVRAGFKGEDGHGYLEIDDAAAAIEYAADNGADVISMSWGGYSGSNLIKDALDYAYSEGVVLVASAGNGNTDLKSYPAGYDNVIAVAATDHNDEKASFSNYGDWVDFAAPGVDILSSLPNGTYDSWSGTSMACPHVSGIVGLLLSEDPGLSPESVRGVISCSVDRLTPIENIGSGRVNVYDALLSGPGPATAVIDSPLHGADVEDVNDVFGTACGEGFQYYVLEYGKGRYPGSDDWVEIANSTDPVQDGLLASLDTTTLDEGIYGLRLSVVCDNGIYKGKLWVVVNNEFNTVYVDVDGGSGVDYTSIRGGICGAGNGDTVYVYGGTYYENVKVWKSVNITGENTSITIIDGSWRDDVVFIFVDYVGISGFTIKHSDFYGYGIFVSGSCGVLVTENKINSNYFGLLLLNSTCNLVSKNTIICNDCYGVKIYGGSCNNVSGNNITSQLEEGVIICGGSSNNNVSENYITQNVGGFDIEGSCYNNISKNYIKRNLFYGIKIYDGSCYNVVFKNDILKNFVGILIQDGSCDNVICGNNIRENYQPSVSNGGVSIVDGSNNNYIYHNDFILNIQNGYDECDNQWDDGYPSGGNFWFDYIGFDFFKGPDQNILGEDGIGDKPYNIPGGGNQDRYPMKRPCSGQSSQISIQQVSKVLFKLNILQRILGFSGFPNVQ